ncbi:MAG TPA: glycosyltransferase family 2 protein [Gaiellaceae bacterium]|nr:glycosyltransferase family 2 protein [Gaiellaceae bacterium]
MSVAAVVIWTPGDPDPQPCLDSLAPQVDELVITVNPGGSPSTNGAHAIENERTLGFGANINRGVAATTATYVVASNPDIEATPGAIATLAEFADAHPRCGIAAPQLRYPDGRWQPSRRSFPTVRGTLVRRTPLRRAMRPEERQRRHYLLDERPTEPAESDWFLGAFLLLRRAMLDELGGLDEGYHLYGDDIDLAYRARKAGWERWYVPDAVVVHHHQALTDRRFLTRRTIWHWRSILRFVRKHPESLRAL